MQHQIKKAQMMARRHRRIRGSLSGTAERPRLCVHRTHKQIYVQVIDDVAGGTRVAESGTLWGPHLGLGAEIALGPSASLNAGMDVVGYVNRAPTDLTTAGAMTTNVGVNFYF